MRTHTGEKPYKCKYCDRAFAQSNDLVKHTRSHIGDNTYQCKQCPQAFRLYSELREHGKEHFIEKNLNKNNDDNLYGQGQLSSTSTISSTSTTIAPQLKIREDIYDIANKSEIEQQQPNFNTDAIKVESIGAD